MFSFTRHAVNEESPRQIADALGLSYPRTTQLLEALARKQAIHSPRCARSTQGRTVNLWALRPSETDPA